MRGICVADRAFQMGKSLGGRPPFWRPKLIKNHPKLMIFDRFLGFFFFVSGVAPGGGSGGAPGGAPGELRGSTFWSKKGVILGSSGGALGELRGSFGGALGELWGSSGGALGELWGSSGEKEKKRREGKRKRRKQEHQSTLPRSNAPIYT